MSSVESLELADAKTSFLERLFLKKNSQLIDPVKKIEDLYPLIDVSKEDLDHETKKKASRKVP